MTILCIMLAECRVLFIVMLNVILLSVSYAEVIMLNVIQPRVVAPFNNDVKIEQGTF
jgi:hypothetical protein